MQNIADMSIRTRLMMVVVQCSGVIGLLAASMFLERRNAELAASLGFAGRVCRLFSRDLHHPVPQKCRNSWMPGASNTTTLNPGIARWYWPIKPSISRRSLSLAWMNAGIGPSLPAGVSLLGLALIVFFFGIATWSPLSIAIWSRMSAFQTDRDHQVCDTGPYQIVRHPTYIGLALFFMGIPLALGSVWGLVSGHHSGPLFCG